MMSPYNFFVHHPIWSLFWMVAIVAVANMLFVLFMLLRLAKYKRQISELNNKHQDMSVYLERELDQVWDVAWQAHDIATGNDHHLKTILLHDEQAQKEKEAKNEVNAAFNRLDEPV